MSNEAQTGRGDEHAARHYARTWRRMSVLRVLALGFLTGFVASIVWTMTSPNDAVWPPRLVIGCWWFGGVFSQWFSLTRCPRCGAPFFFQQGARFRPFRTTCVACDLPTGSTPADGLMHPETTRRGGWL